MIMLSFYRALRAVSMLVSMVEIIFSMDIFVVSELLFFFRRKKKILVFYYCICNFTFFKAVVFG